MNDRRHRGSGFLAPPYLVAVAGSCLIWCVAFGLSGVWRRTFGAPPPVHVYACICLTGVVAAAALRRRLPELTLEAAVLFAPVIGFVGIAVTADVAMIIPALVRGSAGPLGIVAAVGSVTILPIYCAWWALIVGWKFLVPAVWLANLLLWIGARASDRQTTFSCSSTAKRSVIPET
ncbi:MAG TPA: hypothetical protein VKE69_13610 [Planctomycetota bacterium]|nr:hypothetical protein [Planctomycetota bacterium]